MANISKTNSVRKADKPLFQIDKGYEATLPRDEIDTRILELKASGYDLLRISKELKLPKLIVHSKLSRMFPEDLNGAPISFSKDEMKVFRLNRSDILSGLQKELLSLTIEDIKKMTAGSRITAAAILYDKERLESNLSTSNIGMSIFSRIVEESDDIVASQSGHSFKKTIPDATNAARQPEA